MSDEITNETLVAGENVQTENRAEADTSVSAKSETEVVNTTSNVEHKDGKLFVDGVRVYTRDDTNRIAAKAKDEATSRLLGELEVDSLEQVKSVVKQLQTANSDSESLNINTLKDAVKKKEQTVEELRAELNSVKTNFALKEHMVSLKDNMPASWDLNQKQAVVDLMKARDMLHLDGEQFAIKDGENYFTTDGETPDYKSAVEVVGKSLGLQFAKKGVATFDADQQPDTTTSKAVVDQARLKRDHAYRAAYVSVRQLNGSLARSEISDKMVTEHMKRLHRG
tara:strand:+ start:4062 stop:4904 length:843 start_codon:yes stop_codon:yes gene_type:complete